jgi:osmotically-inducible protein OsmY
MVEETHDELFKGLTAALERDTRINLREWPIHIEINKESIVLAGRMENIVAKKAALLTAQEMAENRNLIDQLRIVPVEHKEDGELQEQVIKALLEESALTECSLQVKENGNFKTIRQISKEPGSLIKVSMQEGVVTLTGHVISLSHSRLAEVLTWWTTGCESVNNQLEVIPAEEDTDDEICDAVHIVLEKDPVVPATQLVVSVKNGTVTLDGLVLNQEEKKFAVFDAWYVSGVKNVIDQIKVEGE